MTFTMGNNGMLICTMRWFPEWLIIRSWLLRCNVQNLPNVDKKKADMAQAAPNVIFSTHSSHLFNKKF